MLDSKPLLFPSDFPPVRRSSVQTLQVNLGLKCNQSCQHCHVDAGPRRTEMMSEATVNDVLSCLVSGHFNCLDLTGGAPELHPLFRQLVSTAQSRNVRVIDRCNLSVLFEPGQGDLAEFLAKHRVNIVASLPCYTQENVDQQRGKGVFELSIDAIRKLNSLGYGQQDSGLLLDLVYNPTGAFLPPAQQQLEQDYKSRLSDDFGIVFNSLFTITNMPIRRFGSMLQSTGQFDSYLQLLRDAFQPANLDTVMCRDLVSIDWQGYVYDCDFNQMLDMKIHHNKQPLHVSDLCDASLADEYVHTALHCYGCTAGQGSSCGGALI